MVVPTKMILGSSKGCFVCNKICQYKNVTHPLSYKFSKSMKEYNNSLLYSCNSSKER